jgi:hypothetical protein
MKSAAIAPAWTERHGPRGQTPIPAGRDLAVESLASSNPACSQPSAKATASVRAGETAGAAEDQRRKSTKSGPSALATQPCQNH